MISFEDFIVSIDDADAPPDELNLWLKALWLDANGDWDAAHEIVQETNDAFGFWIHAYLHRKEGDQFNASYWYRRCGKSLPEYNLREEWEGIARIIIEQLNKNVV